jgi:hypothetical protein
VARKTKGWGVLFLVGVLILLAGGSGAKAQGTQKAASTTKKAMALLLPSFRTKIAGLLYKMRLDGFNAIVANVYSLHGGPGGGIAVDILPSKEKWNAPQSFRDALNKHALAMGLVRVHGTGQEWAHVLGVPPDQKERLRAAKTIAEQETMLRQIYYPEEK